MCIPSMAATKREQHVVFLAKDNKTCYSQTICKEILQLSKLWFKPTSNMKVSVPVHKYPHSYHSVLCSHLLNSVYPHLVEVGVKIS